MRPAALDVRQMPPPLPAGLAGRALALNTCVIGDSLHRLPGAVGLKAYHREGMMAGPALTVRVRPGDNLAIHHALDLARPGDVLVVDGGGSLDHALVGAIMQSYAQRRGLAGFVIDGAIRDILHFARRSFPCFARGHTHRGPYKTGPGQINTLISVGGMVVRPGDLVVGDADGVIALAADIADEVLARARAKLKEEEGDLDVIARTGTYPRPWLRDALAACGTGGPETSASGAVGKTGVL